ncbi:deoxyhypusine synthase [Candidatus Woesearchaeota archaeon]|nr:deoxyhypusine synthase [Candidatus Woesearchaeota archaeon]
MKDKLREGKKNVLRESDEPKKYTAIRGYDFNQGVDYEKLLDSFATTGFQATNLAHAIDIVKQMRKDKVTIYLGYTSNMVTSGLRDVFRYLVQHKMVDVIVTTAGGVEEDIIKCIEPFMLGSFEAPGAELRKKGINRTGNIFVPNSRYCRFEDFLMPLLDKMAKEQRETGYIITPSEFTARLGKEIDNPESIYYWAQKNNIPVFCPALTDGSMGDMIYFFKSRKPTVSDDARNSTGIPTYKNPDFSIDITNDMKKLNDLTFDAKKTGVIILGAGVVKHHILNANMMRNGCDYAVYINNAQEFDGSDAGARPDEAVSWGKILPASRSVKVFGDATILFPLIVAKCFGK